eukprot:scaffold8296_cov305-Pinguiococcus_pyrenoidosus.AAC.2
MQCGHASGNCVHRGVVRRPEASGTSAERIETEREAIIQRTLRMSPGLASTACRVTFSRSLGQTLYAAL